MLRYDKEITNSAMIQYIILFAMNELDKPISDAFLTKLMLTSCNINCMDLQIAIANLIDTNHMRQFYSPNNTHMYELLSMGKEVREFARKKVPIYIREQVSEQIEPLFHDEIMRSSVRTRLIPLNNQREYMAEMSVYDRKTPLMQLSFYAGTKAQANAMLQHFAHHPDQVYQEILKALVPEIKQQTDE